jgi:hypothetical protein
MDVSRCMLGFHDVVLCSYVIIRADFKLIHYGSSRLYHNHYGIISRYFALGCVFTMLMDWLVGEIGGGHGHSHGGHGHSHGGLMHSHGEDQVHEHSHGGLRDVLLEITDSHCHSHGHVHHGHPSDVCPSSGYQGSMKMQSGVVRILKEFYHKCKEKIGTLVRTMIKSQFNYL